MNSVDTFQGIRAGLSKVRGPGRMSSLLPLETGWAPPTIIQQRGLEDHLTSTAFRRAVETGQTHVGKRPVSETLKMDLLAPFSVLLATDEVWILQTETGRSKLSRLLSSQEGMSGAEFEPDSLHTKHRLSLLYLADPQATWWQFLYLMGR